MTRWTRKTTLGPGALAAVVALFLAGVGQASAECPSGPTFSPGVIQLHYRENCVELTGLDGERSLKELVETAGQQEGAFSLDDVARVSVFNQQLGRDTPFSGSRLRGGTAIPDYSFDADRTEVAQDGAPFSTYGETGSDRIPEIQVQLNQKQDSRLTVRLTADRTLIKPGDAVNFTANVTPASGSLTYIWDFGDGRQSVVGKARESHRFRAGDSRFTVTVRVAGGTKSGKDSVVITVGKKPKPEKKNEDRQPDTGGSSGGGNPAGGGYPGGSYGTPAAPVVPAPAGPSVSPPASPPAAKQKPQPADDGLIPVRGELVGPPIPGEVIDPNSRPPAADSAQKAGEKGFGLSGEAKTALGVIALLGLGGLAELRSFSRLRSD